jgi:hypothetical protein
MKPITDTRCPLCHQPGMKIPKSDARIVTTDLRCTNPICDVRTFRIRTFSRRPMHTTTLASPAAF